MALGSLQNNHVISFRNGIIENRHEIHVAVVDASGNILFSLGDPHRLTLIRSAAKPAQAVAFLETGAAEAYGFDEQDLALACASHNGEERHVSRAAAMLAKGGNRESDLRCGTHPALWPALGRKWIQQDLTLTNVYSNCSGKHAAMLAGAKAIGEATDGYNLLQHPLQQRVRRVVEDLAGLREEDVLWAVDGCNMATPAFPLLYLGKTYAALASAADELATTREPAALPPRLQNMAKVFNAMTTYPWLVGGEERFCTLLMESFGSMMMGKVGADACYGLGLRACESTRRLGTDGPVGIAFKVEDGNLDVLYAVIPEILEQLGIGSAEQRAKLDMFHQKPILNTYGVCTGRLTFPFEILNV